MDLAISNEKIRVHQNVHQSPLRSWTNKGGNMKKKLGGGNQKRWGKIFKMKGGTQLSKLNLGIEEGKNGDFHRQISINFFKNFPAAQKFYPLWTYIEHTTLGSKKCFYSDI